MQMKSVDAAAKVARLLHKKTMGRRYIEVFEVSKTRPLLLNLAPFVVASYPALCLMLCLYYLCMFKNTR